MATAVPSDQDGESSILEAFSDKKNEITKFSITLTASASFQAQQGHLKLSKDCKYLFWVPASPLGASSASMVLSMNNVAGLQPTANQELVIISIQGHNGEQAVHTFTFNENSSDSTAEEGRIFMRYLMEAFWNKHQVRADTNTTSAFLDRLPPELRDIIYKLGVLSDERVSATKDLKPPALLQTCRQIRSETRQMWYKQEFAFHARNCDARLVAKWERNVRTLKIEGTRNNFSIWVSGVPNWRNLVEWCRFIALGKLGKLQNEAEDHSMDTVAVGAHAIAALAKGDRDWASIQESLGSYRVTAGLVDARWLDD